MKYLKFRAWDKINERIVKVVAVSASIYGIKDKPRITYQANVTDYNKVYNNGYKIVDQDGKITILEKENK